MKVCRKLIFVMQMRKNKSNYKVKCPIDVCTLIRVTILFGKDITEERFKIPEGNFGSFWRSKPKFFSNLSKSLSINVADDGRI